MVDLSTLALVREKNAGDMNLMLLKRRYKSAVDEKDKRVLESTIQEVAQRLTEVRRELGKRMQHSRDNIRATSDRLQSALERQMQNVSSDTSEARKKHSSSIIDNIKRLDGVKNAYFQGKLSELQTRFSQQKNRTSDDHIENFDTVAEAVEELAAVQNELENTRQEARRYLNQLQMWQGRATAATNAVSRNEHQSAVLAVRQESLGHQNTLRHEIRKLNQRTQELTAQLDERAKEIEDLSTRVVLPRSLIDPISLGLIGENAVCDNRGNCFDGATIADFFEKTEHDDGTVAHPLTRLRVTRQTFQPVRKVGNTVKTLMTELRGEVLPGNVKCPITGEVIRRPTCNLSGQCFEEAALNDLFLQAEAGGVPAEHPVTHEALVRSDFITDPRLTQLFDSIQAQPTTIAQPPTTINNTSIVFPRNFVDSNGVIRNPVCDKLGNCYDRATISNLFDSRGEGDTIQHPATGEPVKRDAFMDAPADMRESINNLVAQTTPGNAVCPITKQIIQTPTCNFSGVCFEEAALNDLFDRAEADGVPAENPDTGEPLFRTDFTRNVRWGTTLGKVKSHIDAITQELDTSQRELHKTRKEFETYYHDCQNKLTRGQQQLETGQEQLNNGERQLAYTREQLGLRDDALTRQFHRNLQLEEEVKAYKKIEAELKHRIMIYETMHTDFNNEIGKAAHLTKQLRSTERIATVDELSNDLRAMSATEPVAQQPKKERVRRSNQPQFDPKELRRSPRNNNPPKDENFET